MPDNKHNADNSAQPTELVTVNSIAEALGISKTTVSRSLSGKGRVGADTRQRVLDYITEKGCRVNTAESRIVSSHSGSIGVLIPDSPDAADVSYYFECILGICETAALNGYGVLTIAVPENSIEPLRSLVDEHKVDGLIIACELADDTVFESLRSQEMPFVTVGSSSDPRIVQVGPNTFEACRELTRILLSSNERVALLAGDLRSLVHRTRYEGFLMAHTDVGRTADQSRIFLDLNTREAAELALHWLFESGIDCIIASDDVLCCRVINLLRSLGHRIPDDVRVASFCNSTYLAENDPPITAVRINHKELGRKAAHVLFQMLNEHPHKQKTMLDHEILLRRSTT